MKINNARMVFLESATDKKGLFFRNYKKLRNAFGIFEAIGEAIRETRKGNSVMYASRRINVEFSFTDSPEKNNSKPFSGEVSSFTVSTLVDDQ